MEEVKRLTPKPEVLRELFLKCGNVCAFPGCLHPIVDSNGIYVAQLCHIEAAAVGDLVLTPAKVTSSEDNSKICF